MFVREKTINGYTYLYLVESVREHGRAKQRIIKNLGRKDAVLASGDLDRLAASVGRHAERAIVLQGIESGSPEFTPRRIGGPLLFGRLWERTGIREVLDGLLGTRGFEFAVERCVLVATLHRLFVSGSDRDCVNWMRDYDIPGSADLALHHFYRAMAWLGEELPDDEQAGATPFAPRTVKDVIEEKLFDRRRDLFTDLSLVFMDTTSLSFYGEGGETLGERGHSKDYRPDLKQMIVALVIDGEGRPICTEMMPGNTADVAVLVPIIERLRHRFGIGRVCVVADRGMISQATITALEERKLDYILGARERSSAVVRDVVLGDDTPFTPLAIDRQRGETQLFIKEVRVGKQRYIVCRNEAEAAKDKAERQTIIAGLQAQLKKGDKALVGNSAYRRYLRTTGKKAFEIDAGKLGEEARYDGIFVLRTNARITPLQAVLRYRDLLQVETLFQAAKATLDTRPIYHSSDAAIRGHVFCSFLALVLQKELVRDCEAAGVKPEWQPLLRDLDRMQIATLTKDGKSITVRTPVTGQLGSIFKAAGIALPPNVQDAVAA
jgi:hypothetical protein